MCVCVCVIYNKIRKFGMFIFIISILTHIYYLKSNSIKLSI